MAKGGLPKGMAQQIQALQKQLTEAQDEIARSEVTGTAGGGVVKITLRGDQTCTGVEIDQEMLQDADAEMLQDLILAAFNQAQEALTKLSADKLGPLQNMLGF
jgi:DNA-binding YbaB/EbfC family protein